MLKSEVNGGRLHTYGVIPPSTIGLIVIASIVLLPDLIRRVVMDAANNYSTAQHADNLGLACTET